MIRLTRDMDSINITKVNDTNIERNPCYMEHVTKSIVLICINGINVVFLIGLWIFWIRSGVNGQVKSISPRPTKISSTRIRLTYIRKTRKSLFNSLKIVRDFRVSHNFENFCNFSQILRAEVSMQ